jgi:hypothetical protein
MTLFLKDGKVHHIPISGKDEVTDVTGAGTRSARRCALPRQRGGLPRCLPDSELRRGDRRHEAGNGDP